MMIIEQFNEKYKNYIEKRFYGLSINDSRVIRYLDQEFEKEIANNPWFQFAQIKLKFGSVRVYSSSNKSVKWETEIDKILKS